MGAVEREKSVFLGEVGTGSSVAEPVNSAEVKNSSKKLARRKLGEAASSAADDSVQGRRRRTEIDTKKHKERTTTKFIKHKERQQKAKQRGRCFDKLDYSENMGARGANTQSYFINALQSEFKPELQVLAATLV